VRIVERLLVGADADTACAEKLANDGQGKNQPCPQPPESLPSDLLELGSCVCPEGSTDFRSLAEFVVYAEDADVDDRERPLDELYAALLLDYDPYLDTPADRVAYRNYLQPDRPAQDVGQSDYEKAIGRPSPLLRFFRVVGSAGVVDLCNDNDGAKLTTGLHTLRLVVTDRRWFTPVQRDEDGKPLIDDLTGDPVLLPMQTGVPDLAGGATFDTALYVFRCDDGAACDCRATEPP
jgi:hypothetical protein